MLNMSCILVWKNSNYISSYFSRDVHGDMEIAVPARIGHQVTRPNIIIIIELSYCGAAHLTPYEFWKQMTYSIAMAGVN